MRLCISLAVAEDEAFQESVVALLADTRHQPDAIAQIARVCAAAGYTGATEFIRHLQLSGTHAETVVEALGVLDGSEHPLRGVWYSDGRDAGETNVTSPLGPSIMVFGEAGTYLHDGKRWSKVTKWAPTRRMFVRRVGEPKPAPSFQAAGRTFYVGLGEVVDLMFGGDGVSAGKATKASAAAIEAIQSIVDDSAEGQRSLGMLSIQAGQVEAAEAALRAAIDAKKTPTDCWLVLADLLWDSGSKKEAKENYAAYEKKGKKKDNPDGMERAKSRA